jgi:carbonic anhydrase/acetyltransferase-like protein (isoleucine patch superfamily)
MSQSVYQSPQASILTYQGLTPTIPTSVFIGDGARITGDVTFGERCSVWFNAVVRGDVHWIRIGEETNIQDGTIIHGTYKKHATTIGNRVSIGHLAMIHGCTIEDGCLIGMGAILMDGVVVGENSLVAAGALLSPGTIIPPRSLVIGRPGKVVRPLKQEEIDAFNDTTLRYLEYAKGYS